MCGGQLLSAVDRDGNNQMFPIAMWVMEIENYESWTWFMQLLVSDLTLRDGYGLTLISDQQKGLKGVIQDLLPHAEHRNCARHIYANWRKKYPSQALKTTFWEASMATHIATHKRAMRDVKRLSTLAHDKLGKVSRKGRKVHCNICKGEGHNRVRCPKHSTLPGQYLHKHNLKSPRQKRRAKKPSNPPTENAGTAANATETGKGKDKITFMSTPTLVRKKKTSKTTVEGCTTPASTPPNQRNIRKRQANTRESQSSTCRPFKTPRQKDGSNTKQ